MYSGKKRVENIQRYLSGEKDIGGIAEEEGIQYESAAQRVRRAKVFIIITITQCQKKHRKRCLHTISLILRILVISLFRLL